MRRALFLNISSRNLKTIEGCFEECSQAVRVVQWLYVGLLTRVEVAAVGLVVHDEH